METWEQKIYEPYKSVLLFHAGHVAIMINKTRRDVYRYMEVGWLKGEQAVNRHWRFSLENINEFRRKMLMPELTPDEAREFWETCEKL